MKMTLKLIKNISSQLSRIQCAPQSREVGDKEKFFLSVRSGEHWNNLPAEIKRARTDASFQ
jgi:hypothetical protein